MAPKQTDMIENPPLPSSSGEEEEESASSGEESDSSGAADSKSNSDPDQAKTKIAHNNTLVTKAIPESSGSMTTTTKPSVAVAVPESSTAKRPLKQTEDDDDDDEVKKKKMKTELVKNQETEEEEEEVKKISGDETKKQLMFQRLFSENDEIALLQGILDFTSTRGDPYEKMDAFCDYVKKLINFDANKSQLVTKIRRLKKKFGNTIKNSLKKGKSEDEIVFSKDLDQKAFELSRKVWGSNGVLASKSRKKLGGSSKEIIKLSNSSKKEVEKPKQNVVSTSRGGGEVASFFKAENASALGLDEYTVTAGWEMVSDGPKKKEMEEKLKKLKATEEELCLQRTGLVAETAKLILNDNASSSCK